MITRLRAEPASYIMTALATTSALIIAFGHMDATAAAIWSGAFTALGTVIVAILARPVDVAAISGAAGILVQSLVLLHVHWDAGEQAAAVAAVNVALGLLAMRLNLTPLVTLRVAAQLRVRREAMRPPP